MFNLGEFVVNASSGICEIKDIVELDMSGDKTLKSYYLLVPVDEQTAKVFIPVDNASQRIRKVIDSDKANQVIEEIPSISEIVVPSEKERELTYKNAIKSCEPEQLVGIIKSLHRSKRERFAQGKKCTAVDERYSKLAENHLYAELAFALGMQKSDMSQLVSERLEMVSV